MEIFSPEAGKKIETLCQTLPFTFGHVGFLHFYFPEEGHYFEGGLDHLCRLF